MNHGFSALMGMLVSTNVFAAITCGSPQATSSQIRDRLYAVKATQTCTMSAKPEKTWPVVAQSYVTRLETDCVKVMGKRETSEGVHLDLRWMTHNNSGVLKYRGDHVVHATEGLDASFASTEVSGTGDMEYVKFVGQTETFRTAGDGDVSLTVETVVHLRKPTLAPRGVFLNQAMSEAKKEVAKEATKLTRWFSGL